jgi:hypothetical protein
MVAQRRVAKRIEGPRICEKAERTAAAAAPKARMRKKTRMGSGEGVLMGNERGG